MNVIRLVLSDYDRTFTDATLRVAPGLPEAIARLRERGVMFSVVSGRKFEFMLDFCRRMDGLVDSFIAENGCVGYTSGRRQVICRAEGRDGLLDALERAAIPYDAGDVVVSVHRSHLPALEAILPRFPGYHLVRNVDSLMLLPRGASKATGVRWLLGVYSLTPAQVACAGDAENDLDMRGLCAVMGAVANALPEVKRVSDYVSLESFGEGLLEFLEYLGRQPDLPEKGANVKTPL